MNSQLLYLVLAAAFAWFMNRRTAAIRRNKPGPRPGAPPAAEESERTRRIREEVIRKIEERRARLGPPPKVLLEPEEGKSPLEPDEAAQTAAVLAAQQKLANQIKALEKESADVGRARPPGGPLTSAGHAMPAILAGPVTLRQAVIWREILGPPVGLR